MVFDFRADPVAGEPPAATAKGKAGANWGIEVAAMDKALTTLLGPESATGAAGTTNPPATGTTGSTTQTKAAAATLDEASRTKLMEVRQRDLAEQKR